MGTRTRKTQQNLARNNAVRAIIGYVLLWLGLGYSSVVVGITALLRLARPTFVAPVATDIFLPVIVPLAVLLMLWGVMRWSRAKDSYILRRLASGMGWSLLLMLAAYMISYWSLLWCLFCLGILWLLMAWYFVQVLRFAQTEVEYRGKVFRKKIQLAVWVTVSAMVFMGGFLWLRMDFGLKNAELSQQNVTEALIARRLIDGHNKVSLELARALVAKCGGKDFEVIHEGRYLDSYGVFRCVNDTEIFYAEASDKKIYMQSYGDIKNSVAAAQLPDVDYFYSFSSWNLDRSNRFAVALTGETPHLARKKYGRMLYDMIRERPQNRNLPVASAAAIDVTIYYHKDFSDATSVEGRLFMVVDQDDVVWRFSKSYAGRNYQFESCYNDVGERLCRNLSEELVLRDSAKEVMEQQSFVTLHLVYSKNGSLVVSYRTFDEMLREAFKSLE